MSRSYDLLVKTIFNEHTSDRAKLGRTNAKRCFISVGGTDGDIRTRALSKNSVLRSDRAEARSEYAAGAVRIVS